MSKVKAREIYEECQTVRHFEIVGRVTTFDQGWRTRHAVTVTALDDGTDELRIFIDELMPFDTTDAQAIRKCIDVIDENMAELKRIYWVPTPVVQDTNEPPF